MPQSGRGRPNLSRQQHALATTSRGGPRGAVLHEGQGGPVFLALKN